AAMEAGQSRRDAAWAGADDGDVGHATCAIGGAQAAIDHVFDHYAAEIGGGLHQRVTRDFADQVLARHPGLGELVEVRLPVARPLRSFRVHDQRLGRTGPHTGLALNTILEVEDTTLVVDQIQNVSRTNSDAGVTTSTAVVVDAVNQNSWPWSCRKCARGTL